MFSSRLPRATAALFSTAQSHEQDQNLDLITISAHDIDRFSLTCLCRRVVRPYIYTREMRVSRETENRIACSISLVASCAWASERCSACGT